MSDLSTRISEILAQHGSESLRCFLPCGYHATSRADHHAHVTALIIEALTPDIDDVAEAIDQLSDYGIAAAREALKPIRAVYKHLAKTADGLGEHSSIRLGMKVVLNDLAPLIYTTEELS